MKLKRKSDAAREEREPGFAKKGKTEAGPNGTIFGRFARKFTNDNFDAFKAWTFPFDPQTEYGVGAMQSLLDGHELGLGPIGKIDRTILINDEEDTDMAQALANSLVSAQNEARRHAKGKARADNEFPLENEAAGSKDVNLSIDPGAHLAATSASLKSKFEEDRRQGGAGSSKDQEEEKRIGVESAESISAGMIGHDEKQNGGDKRASTAVEGEKEATAGASAGSTAHTRTTHEFHDPSFYPFFRYPILGQRDPRLSFEAASDVEIAHLRIADGRNAFRTDTGFIGFGPLTTKPGDIVVVVAGGDVPLILRPRLNYFLLVGQAYVHGVMFGELFEQCDVFNKGSTSKLPLQPFEIR